jgi:hypothetical protein
MKRFFTVCIVCIGLGAASQAIGQTAAPVTKSSRPEASEDMSFSIGAHAGLQGYGIDLIGKIDRHFAFRIGASHLPGLSYNLGTLSMGQVSTKVDVNSENFTNLHIYFDYFPFIRSGFRVTAGYAYFGASSGKATVTPVGTYKYNEYPLTAEQVGSGIATLTWDGISPYLGAGYVFGANNGKHLHFSVDLGTYYLPEPIADLKGTGLLSQTGVNQVQFQENTKDYRWLPVLQFGLTYTFGPTKK